MTLQQYIDIFYNAFIGYAKYLGSEVLNPNWGNYFYWLIAISVIVGALEVAFPWRKDQPLVRKDFFLDLFYMFFNFFLFGLIGYNALSEVVVTFFNTEILGGVFGIKNLVAISVKALPIGIQLLLMFVIRDFIQWNIHRLLHRTAWLWEFHKLHHSVEEMGFAAHLRYHWGENIIYRVLEYIPLALIGFGIKDFIIVHLIGLTIGHLNHANIYLPIGRLRYIFNTPQMHIWHHAEELPTRTGVNFGLSLSLWDYLFKTAYIPHDGRDIKLGFKDGQDFPSSFWQQLITPFKRLK
jgi:sterol desaturase/sphingolipid hydroxylase (fatty acid hydroxylase superfamily)